MLKTALCLALATFAVAENCDCDGYVECFKQAKKNQAARQAEIHQCFTDCESNLDKKIQAALHACRPPVRDDSEFLCILENTCRTRPAVVEQKQITDSGTSAKNPITTVKPVPLSMIYGSLSKREQATVDDFSSCANKCLQNTAEAEEPSDESCRASFPSCGMDSDKLATAAEKCSSESTGPSAGGCECLRDELKIKDQNACQAA